MKASELVGAVAGLWRFPVKSMLGEQLEEAELTARGLLGDRVYALIDAETGKVVSAKSVKMFPDLLDCRATFLEAPQSGRELPPVRITLPDGPSVTSDSSEVDRVLSKYFRRNVTLARTAPDDFNIDQYHPDVEDLDPEGHRDTFVEQKLGSAFFAQAGLPSPVPVGSFFDLFPITILTTSTLNQLNALQPASRFDQRRFRMNVIVATSEEGFVENNWVSRETQYRRAGSTQSGPARSAMCDDHARAGRAPQGYRRAAHARSAQQSSSRRRRPVSLRGRLRRGRSPRDYALR